ncbi:MAG: histidine kinase [Ferruginibacter sp.]
MTKRLQNTLLHIIGSLIFLSVPLLNSQEFKQYGRLAFGVEQRQDLLQFFLLLIFFYLNYFLLIPKLVFTKRYFVYAILVLGCMFAIASLPHLLVNPGGGVPPEPMHGMGGRPGPPPDGRGGPPPAGINFFFSRINHNVFLFIAVVSFSLLLKLRERWLETEKEKLNAELQYLKAQINPHFLYNTLNSIYALALQKADNTAEAVQQLSGLMRYILTESASETVPLQKEIQHIESFIKLQQLRFGNEINLMYSVNGDPEGKKIAPLLLITFIENAFKYGVNAEEDSEIVIRIDIKEDHMEMLVRNKTVSTIIPDDHNTKMGLNITQERLRLHYPSAHELNISEKDGYYTVLLSIEL